MSYPEQLCTFAQLCKWIIAALNPYKVWRGWREGSCVVIRALECDLSPLEGSCEDIKKLQLLMLPPRLLEVFNELIHLLKFAAVVLMFLMQNSYSLMVWVISGDATASAFWEHLWWLGCQRVKKRICCLFLAMFDSKYNIPRDFVVTDIFDSFQADLFVEKILSGSFSLCVFRLLLGLTAKYCFLYSSGYLKWCHFFFWLTWNFPFFKVFTERRY